MAIELTDNAAAAIKSFIQEKDLSEDVTYLRIGVKGGGCSGFSYILDLTEKVGDNDETFEIAGVRVVCDPRSMLYLDGTQIDYKDEFMQRGFAFNNPNATATCGCGSSFSA